jgi:hypothetical protein
VAALVNGQDLGSGSSDVDTEKSAHEGCGCVAVVEFREKLTVQCRPIPIT